MAVSAYSIVRDKYSHKWAQIVKITLNGKKGKTWTKDLKFHMIELDTKAMAENVKTTNLTWRKWKQIQTHKVNQNNYFCPLNKTGTGRIEMWEQG